MNRVTSLSLCKPLVVMLLVLGAWGQMAQAADYVPLPEATHLPDSTPSTPQTAVLAGGCFWGMELVFSHVKGVLEVVSGYAGGEAQTARYAQVSSGTTGHAESVRITYDPAQVRFTDLLRIYFSVAHDPTQVNRQGPDVGSQYRSAVFAVNEEQARLAKDYIQQLEKAQMFAAPIATQVSRLSAFYPAESYHQNYAALHPDSLYIRFNDLPKLHAFEQHFPQRYQAQATN